MKGSWVQECRDGGRPNLILRWCCCEVWASARKPSNIARPQQEASQATRGYLGKQQTPIRSIKTMGSVYAEFVFSSPSSLCLYSLHL